MMRGARRSERAHAKTSRVALLVLSRPGSSQIVECTAARAATQSTSSRFCRFHAAEIAAFDASGHRPRQFVEVRGECVRGWLWQRPCIEL